MRKKNFKESIWQLNHRRGRKKLYKFLNIFIATATVLNLSLSANLIPRAFATSPSTVTICHYQSSESNPYNQLEVSSNAIGGHFENNGTPKAGHETDLLLPAGATCPVANPPAGQSCGIDIALVLDSSGSIDNSNLDLMKSSFKNFVDSMLPGTPTVFSVTDFDTTATVVSTFSDNITTVKTAIDIPTSGGGTNWEDGLLKSSGTFDPRSDVPNLIIFASDGEPTFNNGPDGDNTGWLMDGEDLTRAIIQANTIKNAGTRIITLGIGSSVSEANLKSISGADAYYSAANFSDLAGALDDITTELCGGTITVNKIIDADGNLETKDDQAPGEGWQFNVAGEEKTTDANGQTSPKEVDSGSYSVGETNQTGYQLIDANCTGATDNGSKEGDSIYGIQIENSDIVTCAFYNSPKAGTLTVYKIVNNNYGGDAIASDFTIEVSNGSPGSFQGSDQDGVQVTIPAGASFDVSETDGPEGYAGSYSGTCSGTMVPDGQVSCTITNEQLDPHRDEGTITVIKNVINDNGGTADASDFTLYVGSYTVTSGASNYYAPGEYILSEDLNVSGYENTGILCVDGKIETEGGTVTLEAGHAITCTITNDDIQPKLTVIKEVIGGEAQISDFPLSVALGQNDPVSVTSGATNGFDAGDYVVSEINSQPNYSSSFSENCLNGQISLQIGDEKICTITNTYTLEPTYSLHGIKWNDANADSEFDCPGEVCEQKLSGWTIFLDEDEDKQLDENEIRSVTSSEEGENFGWYWFNDLPAGDYSICEVQQNGWTQTYPADGNCHTVTLPNDSQLTQNSVLAPQYDFGNHQNEILQCTGSGTYTVNADFDKGSLINVNYTPADQLQLSDQVNAFNFIWVAVSTKGTVVKINTDTGAIVGEYKTSPSSHGNGDPSRTTVDKDGSVWLSNRSDIFEGKGSIIHIGLVENGQCEDRNGNGVIDTSVAQNDIKSWTDASGDRNVATAADECIVHYVKIPNSSGTRHVSVDKDNNIWVAGYYTRNFDLVKGGKWNVPGSGTIIRSESSVGYGGYGGLIDKNGVIWSAANLLRWDTSLPLSGPNGVNWTGYNHSSYGLCIDSQGNVFNTEYGSNVYKHAPDGTLLATFTHGTYSAQGCVVDKNDDLWIAGSLSGSTVDHLKNDGTFVGSVPVGSGPTGVAVDANGKIWATNYYSGNVSRIDPTLGAIGADSVTKIGAVDFTSVYLGGNPYNYSDMTGSTLSGKAESGTWTVVHDGLVADYPWKNISWSAALNDGNISVTVATSTDGLIFGAPQTITSGQSLASLTSRYLKIVVSFDRSEAGNSPVLYDLTATRECGQDEPTPPTPAPIQPSGGGGSTPYWLLGTSTSLMITPAVLGETLKPILKFSKTSSAIAVFAGKKDIGYSLTIENTGNSSAYDLIVTDKLPTHLTFEDGKTEHTWTIGELKAGEKKILSYKVNSSSDAPQGDYVNNATLTSSNHTTLAAKTTIKISVPQVLGEKLPYTGFSSFEFLLLLVVMGALFFVGRRKQLSQN